MISRTSRHALNVVLLVAAQPVTSLITTQRLSDALGLSVSYLEGILKILKQASIVSAFKGPGGGYQLITDAKLLSVWDVLAVFNKHSEFLPAVATHENNLTDQLESAFMQNTIDFFKSKKITDFTGEPVNYPSANEGQVTGRFKFKPLPPPLRPSCPNSVFQMYDFMRDIHPVGA
jgi:Rrf2 family protein